MYGRQLTPVQSVLHAIAMLGLKNISRIALTAALSNGFPARTAPWARSWWRHSIASALIADHVGIADLNFDFGYTAGLLHAIGQLALFQNAPEEYPKLTEEAHSSGADVLESEKQRFGADHLELSSLILTNWGLPQSLLQAVCAGHASKPADPLTAAVQAGCWYAESVGFGHCGCISNQQENVSGHAGESLDKYVGDVLTIEVNRIECSLH
jgi:HD-like signal output (HDOD) protein